MKLGVIGGSGLYELDGLSDLRETVCDTPFGSPSDALIEGTLHGTEMVFLPRHGRGHRILPSELNHRANIFAMKTLGVEAIISVSAVGSFHEEMAPGHVVLVDQFVDRTKRNMDHTFFGGGIAGHIAFAHPTCPSLRALLDDVVGDVLDDDPERDGSHLHNGATYLNMEGPAFSTLAESRLYKSWGMDLIGMTNLAEAKLAREAEICYQTVAMVTDYDCWHPDHDHVSLETVIATLMSNAELARQIVRQAAARIGELSSRGCECPSAMACAIVTAPDLIPEKIRHDLAPIFGKYIGKSAE
jgi:5'-methylthioadenosine phosphorylase